jgi:hypothetical protein
MIERLGLTRASRVIEVASNDGYLLRNFLSADIPCLGIEPTASTAELAEALGIPVLREFFGEGVGARLAVEGRQADLIVGNNVYAHVPDINDFTLGLSSAKTSRLHNARIPHVMRLIEKMQFDTVYHEHFLVSFPLHRGRIFRAAGLRVWDVEELPTHGGSLRVYGATPMMIARIPRVAELLSREARFGLQELRPYRGFQAHADRIKDDFVAFLIEEKRGGRKVAAYGAAAKGNTLINYGGVKADLLSFVCDAAPAKQGKFMPGSHIPILHPDALTQRKPDTVVILPWNIGEEVREQLRFIKQWGGRFVTAVPKLEAA